MTPDPAREDWCVPEHLVEMVELCGDDVLREILETFLADTPKRVAKLRGAIDAGDGEQVFKEAHGLKGGCAQIGAVGLAAIAAVLEGNRTKPETWRPLLTSFEAEYVKVDVAMRAHACLS